MDQVMLTDLKDNVAPSTLPANKVMTEHSRLLFLRPSAIHLRSRSFPQTIHTSHPLAMHFLLASIHEDRVA